MRVGVEKEATKTTTSKPPIPYKAESRKR